MAHNSFQLNYDEMAAIAKNFKDEGEDIARLHSETRRRVRDLYKDWVGEGADKFFEEMETRLLPAMQRLSLALFHTQDVSNEIMKIIQGADEETTGYFRDQLSGDDFGASRFGAALEGLGGGQGVDDFGAGKFGEAVPAGGGTSAPDDFGAAKFGEAVGGTDSNAHDPGTGQSHDTSSSQGGGQDHSDQHDKSPKDAKTADQPASTGGGGGGSSSEGLKGDLKNLGVGLGEVTPQNAESGGGSGVPTNMPDHVYSSGNSSDSGGAGPQPGSGDSGDTGPSSPGGGGATAGAAGAAGAAAAGGAAKAIKGKKKKINS